MSAEDKLTDDDPNVMVWEFRGWRMWALLCGALAVNDFLVIGLWEVVT